MNIKELIDGGMKFLDNNDLNGFYDYLWRTETRHDMDIGKITEILEECGIDTVHNLQGVIPHAYLCDSNFIPDSLMNGNVLTFPKNIQTIGNSAFYGNLNPNLEIVDLRNIKFVAMYAFQRACVETIYLPEPTEIKLDTTVFYKSELSKIYFPSGMPYEDDDLLEWIGGYIDDGNEMDIEIGYW